MKKSIFTCIATVCMLISMSALAAVDGLMPSGFGLSAPNTHAQAAPDSWDDIHQSPAPVAASASKVFAHEAHPTLAVHRSFINGGMVAAAHPAPALNQFGLTAEREDSERVSQRARM